MNITYVQVTGTQLRSSDYCYGSRWHNWHKLLFWAIRDSSGQLRGNKSFMSMDNISAMWSNLCCVTS